jgi:hypothetical protein
MAPAPAPSRKTPRPDHRLRHLTITDPDAGEAAFQPQTNAGTYGSFSVAATGAWTYASTTPGRTSRP